MWSFSFFNDVFRKRNVMCTSCVMFPLEVKCAFGTRYGTHHFTANEASNITMRSITSLGAAKLHSKAKITEKYPEIAQSAIFFFFITRGIVEI